MRSLFLEGDRSLHQREVWPQTPADGLWNSAVPRGPPRDPAPAPSRSASRGPWRRATGGMLTWSEQCPPGVRACAGACVRVPGAGNSYESGVCVCLQSPGKVRNPPEVRSSGGGGGGGGDGEPGTFPRVPNLPAMRSNPRRKFANFQRARRGRRVT